jgi:hypothetical protein
MSSPRTSLISRRAEAAYAPAIHAPLSPSIEFNERLTRLYALAQGSPYVFSSPLVPLFRHAFHYHVPRFVYFGPHTSDHSLRLAIHAGFDSADLRGTLALLHFVERLALTAELGHGLDLSVFPLVDVNGLLGQTSQALAERSWTEPGVPEIDLLARDVRSRAYHGFIRIETTPGDDDAVTVRLRGQFAEGLGVELLDSADLAPWSVRWTADAFGTAPTDGPLALSDDLPYAPFELTLGLPAAWSAELHREAVTAILKKFIQRHLAYLAYGQHL